MWRKRLGSMIHGGHAGQDRDAMALELYQQSNQSTESSDPHLHNLLQAARAAKEYIDDRVDTVASESRTNAEALSYAVEQVYVDQVVLKEHLGAHLRSMEAAALRHIDAVSSDLRERQDAVLQALESRVDDGAAASIHANEQRIVACQRTLDNRIDDLEARTKLQVDDMRRSIEAMAVQTPGLVHRVSKLEAFVEQIPIQVTRFEACVETLPQRLVELEGCVQGFMPRVSHLEECATTVPNRVGQLEDRIENLRYSERRMIERVDKLTAASQQAIASAVNRISGRIDRVDRAYVQPLEDSKNQLIEMIERASSSATALVRETETRLLDQAVSRVVFIETAALTASLLDQVTSHGQQIALLNRNTTASPPASSVANEAHVLELVNLRVVQERQAQHITELRAVIEQQRQHLVGQAHELTQLRAAQVHELAQLRAAQDQQQQAFNALRTTHDLRAAAIAANTAASTHSSQTMESLRVWVDAKLTDQEQHCRSIRETCADLEQSLDDRLESWLQRESEILAMRLRADSIASDATASNESDSMLSDVWQGANEIPTRTRDDTDHTEETAGFEPRSSADLQDLTELRAARLDHEVRLRAARLEGERVHAIAMRLHTQRVALERQVREGSVGGLYVRNAQPHDTRTLHGLDVREHQAHEVRAREANDRNAPDVIDIQVHERRMEEAREDQDREEREHRAEQARGHHDREAVERRAEEAHEPRDRGARERRAEQARERHDRDAEASLDGAVFEQAMRREARRSAREAADRLVSEAANEEQSSEHRLHRTRATRGGGEERGASGRANIQEAERGGTRVRHSRRGRGRGRGDPPPQRERSDANAGRGRGRVDRSGVTNGVSPLELARIAARELVQTRADARAAMLRR